MKLLVLFVAVVDATSLGSVLSLRELLFDWAGISRTAFERALIGCYAAAVVAEGLAVRAHFWAWAVALPVTGFVALMMWARTIHLSNRERVVGLVTMGAVFGRAALVIFCGVYVWAVLVIPPHAWTDLLLPLPTIFYAAWYIAVALPHPEDRGRGRKIKALAKKFRDGFAGGLLPIPEGGPA
jgi:hypothetical protein